MKRHLSNGWNIEDGLDVSDFISTSKHIGSDDRDCSTLWSPFHGTLAGRNQAFTRVLEPDMGADAGSLASYERPAGRQPNSRGSRGP